MDANTFHNTIYCTCSECPNCLKREAKRNLKNTAQQKIILKKAQEKQKAKHWKNLFK